MAAASKIEWTDASWTPIRARNASAGGDLAESYKGAHAMRRVGKKAAGRLLDGREWNEMPGRADPHATGGVPSMTTPTSAAAEKFAAYLREAGIPGPWRIDEADPAYVIADDGRPVLQIDPESNEPDDAKVAARALLVTVAVNTMAGFKAAVPEPAEAKGS